jgi:hypothetical protein
MEGKSSEQIYDEQIAPLLLQAAGIAKENDIDFIAVVDIADEDDPYAAAVTRTLGKSPQVAIALVNEAVDACGNFDRLVISVYRKQKGMQHTSAYLKLLDNE